MTAKNYIAPICQFFTFSSRGALLAGSIGGSSQPFVPYTEGNELGGMSGEDYTGQDNSGFELK